MIVVAIIGILAGAIVPLVTGYMGRSRDTARLGHIRQISSGLVNYFTDTGEYPDVSGNGCINTGALVQYMSSIPRDPTGTRITSICNYPGEYAYATGLTMAYNSAFAIQAKLEEGPGWIGPFTSNYFTGSKYVVYMNSKKGDVSAGNNSYFVSAR